MIRMLRSIFSIAAVMILALSCAQDKGNYVYIELDEPVIGDIGDISVLTHERLYVDPEVEGSEEYGYEWKAIDRNGGVEPVILGMDEVLDYEVTLTPGLYSLFQTWRENVKRSFAYLSALAARRRELKSREAM